MQKNWLAYLIGAAIILSILAFFYCSFCHYFNRKKNNSFNSNLVEIAKVISNKTGTLPQPLPLPTSNLSSTALPPV